jgi:hypothetical protein
MAVMDKIEVYKAFRIRAFEDQPGRWLASARKTDGSKIDIDLPGIGLIDSITTPGAHLTAQSAIEFMKQMVDSPSTR